jgi:hypothetical protein
MATLARASPKGFVCPEKQRLSDEFLDALLQVMELQNQESAAVTSRGIWRFDLALMEARKKRDQAKLVYLLHLRGHRC